MKAHKTSNNGKKGVKIPPELHKKLKTLATLLGKKIEFVVAERCERDLEKDLGEAQKKG